MKKNAVLIFIFLLVIYSNSFADNASDIFQEANNYYFKKDYINAIRQFREIVNKYPTSIYIDNALFGLGSSFFELENFKDAIIVYNKIVDEYPNSSFADDALFRLGECYEKLGEFNNAITNYEKLIAQYSNSILVLQSREKIKKLSGYRTASSASATPQVVQEENKRANVIQQPLLQPQQPAIAAQQQLRETVSTPASSVSVRQSANIPIVQPQQIPQNLPVIKAPDLSQEKTITLAEEKKEQTAPQQSAVQQVAEQPKVEQRIEFTPRPTIFTSARPQEQQAVEKKITEKKYIIRPEDTLTSIAEKFYGDFNLYTIIADYNNIADPTKLKVGETIIIPVEESVATPQRDVRALSGFPIKESEEAALENIEEKSSGTRIKSTDDAYIYSYKLERDRKHYENLLNIEQEKRKHLLDKIRTLEMQISRMTLEIETYKNNLNSLQELKNKLADTEKTNQELTEKLKIQTQRDIVKEAKSKADVLKMQKELDELTNKYNVLRKELESKKTDEVLAQREQQLAQASVLINQLNIKIQNLDADNSALRKEIERLRQSLDETEGLRAKLIDTQKQIIDKNRRILEVEEENKKLSAATKNMADSIIFYQTQYTERNKKIADLETEIKTLQTMRAGLADNIATLQSQYNNVLTEKQNLEKEKNEFINKLRQKENEVSNLTKTLDDINRELTLIKSEYSANIEKAGMKNKELELTIQNLSKDRQTLNDEILNLKNRVLELQKQSAVYIEKNANADKTIAELTGQLTKLTAEYALNTEQANKKIKEYEEELKKSKSESAALKTQLENLQKTNQSMKDEATKTNQNLIALQTQIQQLQSEQFKNVNEMKRLQEELEIERKNNNALKEEQRRLNQNIITMHSDLQKLQNEKILSGDEITILRKKLEAEEELKKRLLEEQAKSNQTIVQLQTQIQKLQNENLMNIDKINVKQKEMLDSQLQQYTIMIEKLNADLLKRQNENSQLRQELAFIQQQNNNLKENLTLRENEMKKLRSDIGRAENETITKLKDSNEKLNSQIVELQKKILDLQKEQIRTAPISDVSSVSQPARTSEEIAAAVVASQTQRPQEKQLQQPASPLSKIVLPSNIDQQITRPQQLTASDRGQEQLASSNIQTVQVDENNKKLARDFIARGIISKNRGDYKTAESNYRKAIELDPNNADAYNHLAMLYAEYDDKKLDIAIDLVNKAVSLNSADRGYYYDTLGWIYYKQGNYQNALKFIANAIDLIPVNDKEALANVYYHYGMVYLKLNNENQAFFQFIEVMKLASPNSDIYIKAQQQANRL